MAKATPKITSKAKGKKSEKTKSEKKIDTKEIKSQKVDVPEAEQVIEITTEKKLIALYTLQQIDSQTDKIRIIRGELPLEVQDLEDEIAGLETRVDNYIKELELLKQSIAEKENSIIDSKALIKKYEDQQMNVRNNREYDSLSKEIEFQSLEMQLSEKRIKEFNFKCNAIKEDIENSQQILKEKEDDLEIKKSELKDIIAETEKEENELIKKSEENQKFIEDRLLTAYQRIRKNARNGLAVVQIERDACGGCFNKIPPQHQLDIRMNKKIIVCEYCGRILVDQDIVDIVNN